MATFTWERRENWREAPLYTLWPALNGCPPPVLCPRGSDELHPQFRLTRGSRLPHGEDVQGSKYIEDVLIPLPLPLLPLRSPLEPMSARHHRLLQDCRDPRGVPGEQRSKSSTRSGDGKAPTAVLARAIGRPATESADSLATTWCERGRGRRCGSDSGCGNLVSGSMLTHSRRSGGEGGGSRDCCIGSGCSSADSSFGSSSGIARDGRSGERGCIQGGSRTGNGCSTASGDSGTHGDWRADGH